MTEQPRVVGDDVAVDFDIDARTKTTYPPYRLKMDGRTWTVEPPDAGTVMAAEQAPTTEQFMSLMFEADWDELGPVFRRYEDPSIIFDVAGRIGRHFDLDAASVQRSAPLNRAQRRHPRRT